MTNKIIFGMTLMCIFLGNLYAKNFVKEGKLPSDFVGKKAKLISVNYGDLNGDNRKDMVLIIEEINPNNIKKEEAYDSIRTFNYNPRTLLVMFQDAKGIYRLEPSSVNTQLIPSENDPDNSDLMVDSGINIKNDQLIISSTSMMSMGSWYATSSVLRFRYQDGQFVLIGADTTEWHRASGVGSADSYNYLTNVHKHTEDLVLIETPESEDIKPKITFGKIHPKMKSLTPLSEVESLLYF